MLLYVVNSSLLMQRQSAVVTWTDQSLEKPNYTRNLTHDRERGQSNGAVSQLDICRDKSMR